MLKNTSDHCYHPLSPLSPHTDFSADGLHWDGLEGDNKGEMATCLVSQISDGRQA